MNQENKNYGTQEVVSLIRRYVYGLDYQDEEWNCMVANLSCKENGPLSLTASYNEYLLSFKSANYCYDVFSTYPHLLAFAFALERGLLDKIDLNDEIKQMKGGQLSNNLSNYLDVTPYQHFEFYARQLHKESKKGKRWNALFYLLGASLFFLFVWALIECFQ